MKDIAKLVSECDDIETGKDVETLASQMDPIMYACPVCGDLFKTKGSAEKCRDQPFDDGGLKVGDIVVVPGKWTKWYENDPWVAFAIPANPKSNDHFDHHEHRVPYYVVTAIHSEYRHEHRCLVTLCSLAGGRLDVGWNPANGDGHHALYCLDGRRCDVGSTWYEQIEPYMKGLKPSAQLIEEAARLARLGISTRNLL